MGKKAIKYLIILLIVPLIISLIIAIVSGKAENNSNDSYNSLDGKFNHGNYTEEDEIKRSDPFIYLSVFTLVIIGSGVWIYVKNKGNV